MTDSHAACRFRVHRIVQSKKLKLNEVKMSFTHSIRGLLVAVLSLFLSVGAAQATSYQLHDHPDGAMTAHSYGLRLDSEGMLFSMTGGGGGLYMHVNETDETALLTGTIFESHSDGSFGTTGWTVDYLLTDLVIDADGTFEAFNGMGTLTDGTTTIQLDGKAEKDGSVFDFEIDHRLPSGSNTFTGAGWIMAENTNDFLVTAVVVPLPATLCLMLGGLGLLGAAGVARRKTA